MQIAIDGKETEQVTVSKGLGQGPNAAPLKS